MWDVEAGQELFALTSAGGYVDRSGVIAFSGDSARLVECASLYHASAAPWHAA